MLWLYGAKRHRKSIRCHRMNYKITRINCALFLSKFWGDTWCQTAGDFHSPFPLSLYFLSSLYPQYPFLLSLHSIVCVLLCFCNFCASTIPPSPLRKIGRTMQEQIGVTTPETPECCIKRYIFMFKKEIRRQALTGLTDSKWSDTRTYRVLVG